MRLRTFILAILLGAFGTSQAQDYDLGFFSGASGYQGDLTPKRITPQSWRPAGGLLYRYNMHPNLSLRGNLNLGYMAAYDRYYNDGDDIGSKLRKARNINFHAPILEVSGVVEWNIMKYIAGSKKYGKWTPYLFAGIGLAYTTPSTWFQGERISVINEATEANKDYGPIKLAIPFGGGVKISLKNNWTLGLEAGPRLTFSDHLDDVSGAYTGDLSGSGATLSNPSNMQKSPGDLRGNPGYNDWYFFSGFTLSKTIRPFRCR